MPLYEYRCEACGHRFEKIQKFSDPLIEECPQCGRNAVQKLVSSPAIQFKGTGWYITDYARKGAATGQDGSPKAAETGTAESKADTKPAEGKGSESKTADTPKSESKAEKADSPKAKVDSQ